MGFESQPIIKNTAVDNVTLETNSSGEIQIKSISASNLWRLDSGTDFIEGTLASQNVVSNGEVKITDTFTINTTGDYVFGGEVKIYNSSTYANWILEVNGTDVQTINSNGTTNVFDLKLFTVRTFTSGDIVKLKLQRTSGTANTFYVQKRGIYGKVALKTDIAFGII